MIASATWHRIMTVIFGMATRRQWIAAMAGVALSAGCGAGASAETIDQP
jgi:hypothetical protein